MGTGSGDDLTAAVAGLGLLSGTTSQACTGLSWQLCLQTLSPAQGISLMHQLLFLRKIT